MATTIPCQTETHELLRSAKQGGETWDSLLLAMFEQYDPDKRHSNSSQMRAEFFDREDSTKEGSISSGVIDRDITQK